jgi:hypothetical protein
MKKDNLFKKISDAEDAFGLAHQGDDLEKIKKTALDFHALVHPAEVSGTKEKTIADCVFDYMAAGHQNDIVPRQDYDVDLKYAGTNAVPLCWHFWHTYRIEDLVSNILMANGKQIFNDEWKEKIGASITDTGNALEFDEAVSFGKSINVPNLRRYMIAVGKNTREIIKGLTLEQIKTKVPEEWVMRILEEGGVTVDFRSVWLLVFWGRLTVGGMLSIPITDHHMMHLTPCVNNLPIEF